MVDIGEAGGVMLLGLWEASNRNCMAMGLKQPKNSMLKHLML
jgi:hypothetical protein